MRELYVQTGDYDGCCAISILSEFPTETGEFNSESGYKDLKGPLTDSEWFELLGINKYELQRAIVTFAGARGSGPLGSGNYGPCTPQKLAQWLRKQGEKVSTGASGVNEGSGNTITLYSWAPSDKFHKKLQKYYDKKNKKNAGIERGARAA